eukprot:6211723-Pleurochrysis_carterae.AAC.3
MSITCGRSDSRRRLMFGRVGADGADAACGDSLALENLRARYRRLKAEFFSTTARRYAFSSSSLLISLGDFLCLAAFAVVGDTGGVAGALPVRAVSARVAAESSKRAGGGFAFASRRDLARSRRGIEAASGRPEPSRAPPREDGRFDGKRSKSKSYTAPTTPLLVEAWPLEALAVDGGGFASGAK